MIIVMVEKAKKAKAINKSQTDITDELEVEFENIKD